MKYLLLTHNLGGNPMNMSIKTFAYATVVSILLLSCNDTIGLNLSSRDDNYATEGSELKLPDSPVIMVSEKIIGVCLSPTPSEKDTLYFSEQELADGIINLWFRSWGGGCEYARRVYKVRQVEGAEPEFSGYENSCSPPFPKPSKDTLFFSKQGGIDSLTVDGGRDDLSLSPSWNNECEHIRTEHNAPITKIECPWFSLTQTSENSLFVSVDENKTSEERWKFINFNAWCGHFIIIQSAE